MKRVERFQTSDGAMHVGQIAAERHADKRYGALLTSLAHRAVQQTKYTQMYLWLDNNLGEFEELMALKADMHLEDTNEQGD